MNPEQEMAEWLAKGGEFVEREAPLYAQDILDWQLTMGMAQVTGGVVALLAVGLLTYVTYRNRAMFKAEAPDWKFVVNALLWIPGIVSLVLGLVGVTEGTIRIVKVKVAPRVVIVESLR